MVATPNILIGPGTLYAAPLLTAEPTNTVVGSVFTDAWAVAWIPVGATDDGTEIKISTKIEAVNVAEIFDPIQWVTTSREAAVSFALADVTVSNLKRLMNGGTVTTVSGTGATTLTSFTPPTPGSEVRLMLGWESTDKTVRFIAYQAFQGGDITLGMKKAPKNTTLPGDFKLEVPAAGNPFKFYTAGTVRVGT